MTPFEPAFAAWLADALAQEIPAGVAAFCFNLSEIEAEQARFDVSLVGARAFDPGDDDWACDEAWAPDPPGIAIPARWSGEEWPFCLAKMTALVAGMLAQDDPALAPLKAGEAVAVGFVDGDLEIVWRRP